MNERYYICDKDNNEIVYGYIDYNRLNGFKIKPQNTIPYEGVEVSHLVLVKPELIKQVLKRKTKHQLDAYLAFLLSTLEDDDDDDPETIELVIDNVTRYKNIILNKYSKFLDKRYINAILRKVGMIENELKQKLAELSYSDEKHIGHSR
jgi:mannose-6-phosphate isomerase class I